MASPEDIERAQRGKGVWNAWAGKNPGAEVDFTGHLASIDFAGFVFPGKANFESVQFDESVSFQGAEFQGDAWFRYAHFHAVDFGNAIFGARAMFENVEFRGPVVYLHATFEGQADFQGAKLIRRDSSISFDHAKFHGNANFEYTEFHSGISFKKADFLCLATFNTAQMHTRAVFIDCAFGSVPTFHGAKLHEDTTFESVVWPERPHTDQSPYDAARAWARLRVEMTRLHKHEDELFFFAMELNARAHDRRNEPLAKRLLYRSYLALGAGRSVLKPFGWLLGLNAVLFLPIYWYATSGIQWCNLSVRDILAGIVNFNIPADVVSFTLGQALPLIGGSNPERADIYKRLFPSSDSSGIDVPLWLEFMVIFQQLAGIALLFLIGLALRNRFRMK